MHKVQQKLQIRRRSLALSLKNMAEQRPDAHILFQLLAESMPANHKTGFSISWKLLSGIPIKNKIPRTKLVRFST
jgi:hypothetical protein